jgi:ribosomal protein S6--L-glutamate ligase
VLAKHGIPAPRCWITADLSLLRDVVRQMPIIIKPFMGWRGEGIRIVHNERELASYPALNCPMLIQEYVRGSGEDLRLYVAGQEVFATRKRFSQSSFSIPGQPVVVSSQMRDMALACGSAFGLALFGVDVIETAEGPFVVDVNYFPGYKGIPGADEVVADFIERYAYGVLPETKAALA